MQNIKIDIVEINGNLSLCCYVGASSSEECFFELVVEEFGVDFAFWLAKPDMNFLYRQRRSHSGIANAFSVDEAKTFFENDAYYVAEIDELVQDYQSLSLRHSII